MPAFVVEQVTMEGPNNTLDEASFPVFIFIIAHSH